MFYMGGDPSSGRLSIYSPSYVNSSNTRFRKRFFQMPSSINKIGRYCNQTLNTLLLTHTKHQESMSIYDRSKWIWISLYPFIDYDIHTSLRPPCIECTVLTLTIIYYGCPIFLSLYETFMHDFILGYYGPFRSYTSATCYILRLCLYQMGLRALHVNPWHAAASSIYYTATTTLVRWQYITMPSMIILAYVPIIIALFLSLSGNVKVNPGPVPFNITQHATPNANLPGIPNQGPSQSDHVNIMNWNCQGINSKLDQLPDLFKAHDVHIAVLTETQRTIGVERNKQIQTLKGYTFHFSSYVDTSHTAFFMPTRLREWGVCIAIKVGLAYGVLPLTTLSSKHKCCTGL
jgi:hypothetical protein